MKNLKSRELSYTLIAAILFASFTMSAQQMRRAGGDNRPAQMEQHQRSDRGMQEKEPKRPRIPNLTEEQKEQLQTWKIEADKIALPLENQMGEKEAQLITLTTSENYNQEAVESLIDDIGAIRIDLEKLKASQIQKVKSVLTEEQLVVFNKQLAKGPRKHQRRG